MEVAGLRYLLDTNAVSELCKPVPNAAFLKAFRSRQLRCAVSSVSVFELRRGIGLMPLGKRRTYIADAVEVILEACPAVFGYSKEAASWHADECIRLEKTGLTPPYVDGQIAAIAACHGLTLVTHNTKDFKNFRGLKVVDWLK
jgi:tRNA(fMet)-specific endonuclease VapC